MKIKNWSYLLFSTILLVGCFYACEQHDEAANGNSRFSRFFYAADADMYLQKIISRLEQKNDSIDFATEFIETYGYPLWGNAVAFSEGVCFTYAVPVKSLLPNSEINAIWFFVMNDSCTNYHIYSREMADAITRQLGDEIEQTWMFDYFTYHALHKEPVSGLKFEAKPTTRTTQVAMECENTVWVDGNIINVDVHCWNSGGGAGDRGNTDFSSSGSVEENRPTTGGGGGGGSSSGSISSSPTTPKASKLFQATLMQSEWNKLELVISKIMLDCMGGTLYNALVLSGKIKIKITSNESSYDSEKRIINLNNKMESNQLFHEMLHAYQSSKLSASDYNKSTINIEIEAHYAQYLYLSKLKEYGGSKWEKDWTRHPRLSAIRDINKYVDKKGIIALQKSNEELDYTLNKVASMFETHDYIDTNVYKYNWNIKGINNFNSLREITKKC